MIALEIMLVLAVITAVGYPLFFKPAIGPAVAEEGDEYHKLVSAKEAAFVALKDLDFDHRSGKIDDEDYEQLKQRYEIEAVSVMKRMDSSGRSEAPKPKGRFCPSCGAKSETADKFCRSCGTKLG